MDEIELQLCLDIDPVKPSHEAKQVQAPVPVPVSGRTGPKIRPGKRSARDNDNDRDRDRDDTLTLIAPSPSTSNSTSTSTSTPIPTPDFPKPHHRTEHTCPKNETDEADPEGDRELERQPNECGCQQERGSEREGGRYFALPPRKKVRTSVSVSAAEKRGALQLEDNADQAAEGISQVVSLDSRAEAIIPAVKAAVEDGRHRYLDGLENDAEGPDLDCGGGMDAVVDGDGDADTDKAMDTDPDPDSTPRQFQVKYLMHHRPQAPFIYFPDCDGPYKPATSFPESLHSSAQSGRTHHRFVIYEDADDMEIEIAGAWVQSWYLSPEDDKENAEQAED